MAKNTKTAAKTAKRGTTKAIPAAKTVSTDRTAKKRRARRWDGKGVLSRFSVTMPEPLLLEFEERVRGTGIENRSEALRQLVRRYISEERWQTNEGEVYGTVTLVYDHHVPNLAARLTAAQHEHGSIILCNTHVHVSGDTCLECIIMKGPALKIQKFFEALRKIRGIRSLDTVVTSDA